MIDSEQMRIVNNSENRGFGAANNQAFALTDSPFVFFSISTPKFLPARSTR